MIQHRKTPSSREENELLFHQIINGDQDACHRLVEGNMAYVVNRVDAFLEVWPKFAYLREDLVSEGYLTLARIVDYLRRNKRVQVGNFNPQGLISVSLRNALLKLIRVERAVPLTDEIASGLSYDDIGLKELWMDILTVCEDAQDREIIELRQQSYVDDQIADRMGLYAMYVWRVRNAIYQRLRQRGLILEQTRNFGGSFQGFGSKSL